ncbi:MAG: S1/P1 nuclease [Parashewanella sp.]
MKRSLRFSIAIAITAGLISGAANAFGPNGHRIVAQIAQINLTPKAKTELLRISKGLPLARLSTWPDEIRSDPSWRRASPWHYVSIEDNETWKTVKRSPKGDVLEALDRFEAQLRDNSLSDEKKWQALAFYIHFLGDLHQPLHVGHSYDRGGNDVKVNWFGESSNLHRVWDSQLIENQQLSYTEYVEFLPVTQQQRVDWSKGSYQDWATESKNMRDQAYQFEKADNGEVYLSYRYVFKHRDQVELRLKQAGIRLAVKLNQIFN